jgi:isoquinoline 1-oxidoreductase alpha subunit
MPLKLKVNGEVMQVDAAPEMPLLWVLRDLLDLKGAKFGCGAGLCGACTVHVNGRAVRSCITPVSSVANDAITTIEGLSPDGSHPVQTAWIEEDVAQCGYCQAGQVMTAAAFLKATPNPTDDQITNAMTNNLCRCGTYPRIQVAVRHAAMLAAKAGGRQS